MARVMVTLRMPAEDLEAADELARAFGVSRSELLRTLVRRRVEEERRQRRASREPAAL